MSDLRDNFRRVQRAYDMRRSARPQQPLGVRDGAQVRVNGRPVTAKEVSNEALGSGDSVIISGSGGEVHQERGRVRRVEAERALLTGLGNVKILVEVARGADIEYWLGGDRKSPIKIVSIVKADLSSVAFESTGAGLDDWLLALKTKVGSQYQIRLFSANGIIQDSTSAKNKYLEYKGSGFWVSAVLESPPFSYTSTSTGSQTNIGGVVTDYISGSVFGGSIQWSFPFTNFDASLGGTSGFNISSVVSTITQPPPGDFDWNQRGGRSSGQNDQYSWTPTPGIFQGLDYLTGTGFCTPPESGFVSVRYGIRNASESSYLNILEESSSYSVSFFGISFHELAGDSRYEFSRSRQYQSIGYFGANQTFPIVCTEGPGPIPGTFYGAYVVQAPIITPAPTPGPPVTILSEVEVRRKTQRVFIAPNEIRNNEFDFSKNGSGESTSRLDYRSVLCFDDANSFVYQVTTTLGTTFYQNTRGSEIVVNGFSVNDSSVVVGNKTEIYTIASTIFQSGDWKQKEMKATVQVKELNGNSYIDAPSVERRILPIKASFLGVSEADIKIVSARAWSGA